MNHEFPFLIYRSAEEDISVNAIIKDETIWLTQKSMAELFDVDKSTISRHLKNIFQDGELNEKVVSIKRVTKVVKGGRNFRFTALVVVGDGNGHVGAGLGKASEIPEAIRKGKEDAMKKLITVKLDEVGSVTHDVTGKHTGASVLLKKSPEGTGIIAGGPARNVCELAGIKNIRTKSLGSNNKQNVVLATINALSQLKSPEEVAKLRGKSVEEIVG